MAEHHQAQPQRYGTDRRGRYDDQPPQRHAARHGQQRQARAAGEAIAGEREPDWPPPLPPGGDEEIPF